MCNKVLFHAPDSPTIASISPLATWKERFSKSTNSDSPERKAFFRPSPCKITSLAVRCKRLAPRLISDDVLSLEHEPVETLLLPFPGASMQKTVGRHLAVLEGPSARTYGCDGK